VEGPALPLAVDLERVGGEVGSLACSLRQAMALVPLALGYLLSRHAGASWGVGVGVGLKGACPAKPSNARTLAALTAPRPIG
jgi:hypothetical protein